LVPGWGLECDCSPLRPGVPSLQVIGSPLCVSIERSIVGAIRIERNQVTTDPLILRISDSIVDATDPAGVAIGTVGKICADIALRLERSTVIGQIQAHMVELVNNSILLGMVTVCRRQRGCVRFSYLPPGSRTPRRYECQPDLVDQIIANEVASGVIDPTQQDALIAAAHLRVTPKFNSMRYGQPTYCQLANACAVEITSGADDGSEMGAFHDLYQPQRTANLRQRLDEYTPAEVDTGIVFVN
jgi:hypothetical protein